MTIAAAIAMAMTMATTRCVEKNETWRISLVKRSGRCSGGETAKLQSLRRH
jgi:hypothetical protein